MVAPRLLVLVHRVVRTATMCQSPLSPDSSLHMRSSTAHTRPAGRQPVLFLLFVFPRPTTRPHHDPTSIHPHIRYLALLASLRARTAKILANGNVAPTNTHSAETKLETGCCACTTHSLRKARETTRQHGAPDRPTDPKVESWSRGVVESWSRGVVESRSCGVWGSCRGPVCFLACLPACLPACVTRIDVPAECASGTPTDRRTDRPMHRPTGWTGYRFFSLQKCACSAYIHTYIILQRDVVERLAGWLAGLRRSRASPVRLAVSAPKPSVCLTRRRRRRRRRWRVNPSRVLVNHICSACTAPRSKIQVDR
ncbi:hypothetical protein IWZ03DRAFT_55834 [Phyllosticta citriasiana]|uniref:Secreted protein n=1 Tax=Phyllosticta citriasiana TaxID=595635 RepID=A0ABR1KCX6_9PEZI